MADRSDLEEREREGMDRRLRLTHRPVSDATLSRTRESLAFIRESVYESPTLARPPFTRPIRLILLLFHVAKPLVRCVNSCRDLVTTAVREPDWKLLGESRSRDCFVNFGHSLIRSFRGRDAGENDHSTYVLRADSCPEVSKDQFLCFCKKSKVHLKNVFPSKRYFASWRTR